MATQADISSTVPNADTISPSSNPSAAPTSTITPTHFQHRTTTAAPVNPLIDTATPAINTVPIELDSTPVSSPVARTSSWNIKEAIQGAVASAEKKVQAALSQGGSSSSSSNITVKSDEAGLKGRPAASKLRADSAAVMAGPPGTPGPEDFEAAKVDAITPS